MSASPRKDADRRSSFLRSTITLMAAAQAAWDAAAQGGGINPADPYMTVVAYFNALRELGSARRIVEDEIGSRLLTYANRKRLDEAERAVRQSDRSLSSRSN